MGAESVGYHKKAIVERGDDHPGQALAYFSSRGETPLVWGGSGAADLGLSGAAADAAYDALYGSGGARHPETGEQLTATRRPGLELVIAAHKSVAELGVVGRVEDMHSIMNAERDATLDYLDDVTRRRGGRRGVAAARTETTGIVYAHTRHATSRSGDPSPHDHVLLANLVKMGDTGAWKGADTALWREHLHAATAAGRVASAAKAVELGYGIEADDGRSGRLRHWRIAGIPDAVLRVHSKRAAEIQEEMIRTGGTSYRSWDVAQRKTRRAKRHVSTEELLPVWRQELAEVGWPAERLLTAVLEAGWHYQLEPVEVEAALAAAFSDDGGLARRKVFAGKEVIVEVAPWVFGHAPAVLAALAARVLQDPESVPLVGVAGARERVYSLAKVLARETAIAAGVERLAECTDRPSPSPAAALAGANARMGYRLADCQREAVEGMCGSGRGAEIVVGVAGSGKTTMLSVVAAAFEGAGCQVVGTATSGQAARNLGDEAGIGNSRTVASLVWQLDHDRLRMDGRSVVILDEAGMTDDPDMVRLVAKVEAAGAKLIVVGDDRQLGPVGPGGAMGALVARHPEMVHRLTENQRQADPSERAVLEELRAGSVAVAAAWYDSHGRIVCRPDRDETVARTVQGWAADIAAGEDAAMYAYQRGNVAALNAAAREWMVATGRVQGPEVAGFAAGDRLVATAPIPGVMVNSERATVVAVHPDWQLVDVQTADGRMVRLEGDQLDRVGYGYATTVHRSQGVTVDSAHVYADGGGRELSYVAMSRARGVSRVYVVADDTAMAAEDLARDWRQERRPRWAIDTGLPATGQARQHEGDLSQRQIANVLAIAAHERTGPAAAAQRATIDAQLDAYRATLAEIEQQQQYQQGMEVGM